MSNEILRFEYEDDFIELSVAGKESPHEDWLMIHGSWRIGEKSMCGDDPAVEIYELEKMAQEAIDVAIHNEEELMPYFMEQNLAFYVLPNGEGAATNVYFFPEHTLRVTLSREEYEKRCKDGIPYFSKPYEDGDIEKIVDWLEAVLDKYKEEEE